MRRTATLAVAIGLAAGPAWAAAGRPTSTPTPTSTSTPTSLAPALPQATPKAIHSRLSKSQPRLGEPFDWEIELRHAPGEAYALPAQLDLPPFQATGLGCRRAAAGVDAVTTCTIRLAVFELGPHDVPLLRLEATTPQGPRALDVQGPRVEAAGVIDPQAPPDQLQLRAPAAPVPLLLPSWRVLWWALGALAALLAGWLGWRWWRRRAARAAEPPPPLSPAERFARRLDALAADRLPEQGQAREYFFRLTEAVREYLGTLTGVNALELTTGELCATFASLGDPRVDVGALRGFSEEADLVKFARFPAGGHECAAGMRYARGLLETTRGTTTPTSTSTPAAQAPRKPA